MNVRTPRGQWGVLSPAYPWTVKDKVKTYPSLLNYIFDDVTSNPLVLLQRDDVVESRVVDGLKMILTNPAFKQYLKTSPDVVFVNKTQPNLENLYNLHLQNAKHALNRVIIRGSEVADKKEDLEMLGLHVEDDRVVFETQNAHDVKTVIYGRDDARYVFVGNFLQEFLERNEKLPVYFKDLDVINPGIYNLYEKRYSEKILKAMTKINLSNLRKFTDITAYKADPNLFFYLFPKVLHGHRVDDVQRTIDFHVQKNTSYKDEIICRCQLYDLITYNRTHIIKERLLQEFKEIKVPASIETVIVDDTVSAESASEEKVPLEAGSEEKFEDAVSEEKVAVEEKVADAEEKVVVEEKVVEKKTVSYKYLDQMTPIGRIVDPDEGINPFCTRLITFEGVRYNGIVGAIYNHAARDLLNSIKVLSTTTIKNKLLQQFDDAELLKWWEEKGIVVLQKLLESQFYVERFFASRYKDIKPLVFLASKRVVSKPVFEQYIGITVSNEEDNVFTIKGKRYKGFNLAGQFLN